MKNRFKTSFQKLCRKFNISHKTIRRVWQKTDNKKNIWSRNFILGVLYLWVELRSYIGHVRAEPVNSNVYTKRCLPNFHQFITTTQPRDEIIFWINLANFHYARTASMCLVDHNIIFVAKADNSPSIPPTRSIENF